MSNRGAGWLAAGLIVAVLAVLWPRAPVLPFSSFDQPFYLGIAYDIRHAGHFTDGYMFAEIPSDQPRPAGMRFAPLVPTLLAAAAAIDTPFRAAMDCQVETRDRAGQCAHDATVARLGQLAMLILFYWLIWWMAGRIGGPTVAWLTLAIAVPTAPLLLRSVNLLMTETTSVVLVTAATACAIAGLRGRAAWWAACGLALALAILTRPAFFYLGLACLAVAVIRLRPRRCLALFAVTLCLPVAAWMLRNGLVVGHFALTHGYDSHTLVQRISFDSMSWGEYGRSFVCWLPDGSGLGAALFGRHSCDRFGWDERPDTFYSIGLGPMLRETLAAAGGWDNHLGYLLRTYILAGPITHALVTIPLALRGLWVAHWWGVVLAPIAIWLTLRRRDAAFALIAWPAWFMLAFNAAVAVNQVRYNLMLIPMLAIGGALVAALVWRRYPSRRPITRAV